MRKETRMPLPFLLEGDAFLEIGNTVGKQVQSKDVISCLGHNEFEKPVEHPSRDVDISFWNGQWQTEEAADVTLGTAGLHGCRLTKRTDSQEGQEQKRQHSSQAIPTSRE